MIFTLLSLPAKATLMDYHYTYVIDNYIVKVVCEAVLNNMVFYIKICICIYVHRYIIVAENLLDGPILEHYQAHFSVKLHVFDCIIIATCIDNNFLFLHYISVYIRISIMVLNIHS